jgi:hypothetical protein
MPRAESAHVIRWPSGSGRLSVRAPGQTPSMPTPFAAAAATVVVAVPWKSPSAGPPTVVMLEPAISGWLTSIIVSTTPISGLSGPTGGATAVPTTEARQPDAGLAESGSGAWVRWPMRFGSA